MLTWIRRPTCARPVLVRRGSRRKGSTSLPSRKNNKPGAPSPAPAKGDAASPFGDYEPTQKEKTAIKDFVERSRKQSPRAPG